MRRLGLGLFGAAVALSCTARHEQPERTARLAVVVRLPGAQPLPGPNDPPLPLPTDVVDLDFDVFAERADGSPDPSFQGFVRISSVPGSVVEVVGDRANGRNVVLLDGVAQGQRARVRNARGPLRIWAEDIGYVPEAPGKPPACTNGLDDDSDGALDFPDDPGCAFANDDTESGGTHASGVSEAVRFELPRLADLQGRGAVPPYELESVEVATESPANLIVTRIANDGFYVTDTTESDGYGHVFAFTFNTPPGLRVCDRLTRLTGTSSEFFGFTELGFPTFDQHEWQFPSPWSPGDGPCQVPEPVGLPAESTADAALLEKVESALVRVENATVGTLFGPGTPQVGGTPVKVGLEPDKSNCDLDGSGFIDFDTEGSEEAACANACAAEPQCVEWSAYLARGNYRVVLPGGVDTIQVNTASVVGFDPRSARGWTIRSITGTLRNFSGGDLNWTIEARCSDDLVCQNPPSTGDPSTFPQPACSDTAKDPVSSQIACVFPRTTDDPNQETN